MAKIKFKPGTMLAPLPVVMVSCADKEGNTNIITIAWSLLPNDRGESN